MTHLQKEQQVLSDGCADNNSFIHYAFTGRWPISALIFISHLFLICLIIVYAIIIVSYLCFGLVIKWLSRAFLLGWDSFSRDSEGNAQKHHKDNRADGPRKRYKEISTQTPQLSIDRIRIDKFSSFLLLHRCYFLSHKIKALKHTPFFSPQRAQLSLTLPWAFRWGKPISVLRLIKQNNSDRLPWDQQPGRDLNQDVAISCSLRPSRKILQNNTS